MTPVVFKVYNDRIAASFAIPQHTFARCPETVEVPCGPGGIIAVIDYDSDGQPDLSSAYKREEYALAMESMLGLSGRQLSDDAQNAALRRSQHLVGVPRR